MRSSQNFGLLMICLFLNSCSTFRSPSPDQGALEKTWNDKVRMAEAPMISKKDTRIQGQVNFEQMPNSVIVTFHLEGLEPKSNYKLFLYPNQGCSSEKLTDPSVHKTGPAQLMSPLRAGDAGIAENTFKLPDLKVSSLAGDVVVLWSAPPTPVKKSKKTSRQQASVRMACGELRPQAPPVPTTLQAPVTEPTDE